MPVVITAHSLALALSLTRLEAFHAHLGDLTSVWTKPSHLTGPSGLRNASVWGQEKSCKTFTLFFFLHPDSTLATVPDRTLTVRAVGSDVATYLIHIANSVFLCSCHQLQCFSCRTSQLFPYNDDQLCMQLKWLKHEQTSCKPKNLWAGKQTL